MNLERQVAELTDRVAALEEALRSTHAPQPTTTLQQPPPPPPVGMVPNQRLAAPGAPSPTPPTPSTPRANISFDWGIESVLRWAGVVLVSLAAIFLVSTAISRGWIGPELQLLGAAFGGLILLAGAIRLAETRRPWSLALGCGGAVVLIACALATHEWLDVVGPGPALFLAAGAAIGSSGVALHLRLEGIALVAAVVAMVASLETLGEFGDAAALLWIAAFVLAASAIGLMQRWPGVRLVTGWLGALLLTFYALEQDVDGGLRVLGFVGAGVIGTVLWLGPTLVHRLTAKDSGSWGSFNWTTLDYRLVGFVPAWLWTIIVGLVPLETNDAAGLAALAVAACGLGLGELTLGRLERLVSITTILGSLSLMAVGFALYLDGPALMVALAAQAATSYFLAHRLDDRLLTVGSYALAAIASLLALGEMIEAIENDGFENAGYILATAMVLIGWIITAFAIFDTDHEVPHELPVVGAWVGLMLWVTALFNGTSQGLMLISVAWAAMACAGLIVGLTRRIDLIRTMGMATLVLTLGKLVTVDMAGVDVFWRVGLFFVVGSGLIALGLKLPQLLGPAPGSDVEGNTQPPVEDLPDTTDGDAAVTIF